MHTIRRGTIQSVTCIAIGCCGAAVLFALIDRSSDVPPIAVAAPQHESVAPPDLSPADLYERASPSVVTLIVKDKIGEPIGTGSGFIIDEALLSKRHDWQQTDREVPNLSDANGNHAPPGYILTNYHVIRPAIDVDIVFANGETKSAWNVIAEDEQTDLALLCVFPWFDEPPKGIAFALDDPRILTTVYAIGSPRGLQGSASEGKVSAYRELHGGDRWLQTTAAISPGSSGGPLLSADGRLAGVTTITLKNAQNVNFAIPVSAVRTFLATIPFQPRDVAEGASIRWQKETAFDKIKFALLYSSKYSDAERNALKQLEQAGQQMNDGIWPPLLDDARQTIAHTENTIASLPEEFGYLAHYILGESNIWVGLWTALHNKPATTTELESQYRASGHGKAVLYHLMEATRLRPDFSPAYQSLIRHHTQSGHWAEALLVADKLVTLMPRCAEALSERAKCYAELNRPESAKNDLQAANELSPKDPLLRRELAEVLFHLGDYAEAIKSYETMIELLENVESYETLDHSVTEDPGVVEQTHAAVNFFINSAQYHLGIAYRKTGNFDKAISAFTKAKAMGYYDVRSCDTQIIECKRAQR